MKKSLIIGLCGVLVLSSCYSTAGTGAYVGGQFGHVIGSAVGGISGGRHGHDVGSLIGTVGGAVAGAAVGAAVENAQRNKYEKQSAGRYVDRVDSRDGSGFDPQGGGDDRIDFDGASSFSSFQPAAQPLLIRNVRLSDANDDMILTRNEECTVTFEIMNNSGKPLYNVQPTVMEVTGNKHVHISPNLVVDHIRPHKGVRYTATIKADGRLKDGMVKVRIGVSHHNGEISSQTREMVITTRKKLR